MKNDFNGIYEVRLYGRKHSKKAVTLLGRVPGCRFEAGMNRDRISFGPMPFGGQAMRIEVGSVAVSDAHKPFFYAGDEVVIYRGDLTVLITP